MKRVAALVFVLVIVLTVVACSPDDYVPPETGSPSEEGGDGDFDTIVIDFDTFVVRSLLLNGGLEKWVNPTGTSYDVPENWLRHNNYNVRKDSVVVREGCYSARMSSVETGSTARVDQRVAVTPGHRIRIRFSYRVEQWKSKGARTYCYFRTGAAESTNISVADLQSFYSTEEYYIIRGGGRGLTYLPHDMGVWQVFDETITVPPSATYFVFGINSYHGTTLYVDGCSVEEYVEEGI